MKTFYCLAAFAAFMVTLSTDSVAGDDLICKKADKDSFYDLNSDACYTCPKGFKHDRAGGNGINGGACNKVEEVKAVATGGKGPVCVVPAFVSLHENKPWGICMKCPKGRAASYDKNGKAVRWSSPPATEYQHDNLKAGNQVGVCHRWRYALANKIASNVASGPAKATACEAAMATFKAGSAVPKSLKVPDLNAAVKAAGLTADKVKKDLEDYKSTDLDNVAEVLGKVKAVADKFQNVRTELFKDPHVVCDPNLAAKKLADLGLVPPGWNSDSYLTFSISFSLAAGAGAQGGYTLVTNFEDPPFVLGVIGATGGSDGGASLAVGVQYYPEMNNVNDFLGLSLGASAGIGMGVLGAGVDVSFDATKTGADIVQGIGPHGSFGVGASALGVGSVGFSVSNSWDLSK